ncbi:hypothetical protein X732_33055 [Mesorhizobium sp. L2C066B000]|nr:hypothetical protein X732_33055 [Mesorhizobium sp. L2C066B000]
MIELKDIRKSFGQFEVLKGVSLTVQKGEVLSIVGGSGSGKSTMLMCINGLEPIQSGQILVDGTDVHARSTDLNRLRQKIGIVFQQWNAFPHLTALENVMLAPRKVLGKSKKEAEEIAVKQLTLRPSSPVVSSSGWPLHAPSLCRRITCSLTRSPRPSIRNSLARCWTP